MDVSCRSMLMGGTRWTCLWCGMSCSKRSSFCTSWASCSACEAVAYPRPECDAGALPRRCLTAAGLGAKGCCAS